MGHKMVVWLRAVVLQVMLLLSKRREVMVCLVLVSLSIMMAVLCWVLMEEVELASMVVVRVHVVVVRESLQIRRPPSVMVTFSQQLSGVGLWDLAIGC